MGLVLLTERHESKIAGVLSCYDRIITKGTLPEFGDAGGMAAYLTKLRIRIFDFVEFVKPLTEAIKNHAKQVAADNGLEIQYISSKKDFRQEREVAKALEERGSHPGLVRIFSAIEPCTTYEPRFNKETNRAYLKPDDGKCLHYYFYFIDEELGLCYLRVPTWCPFRLQFYCNGHNWLARQLDRRKIGYTQLDNAFLHIDDWAAAQRIANAWDAARLHRKLDHYARLYCPILKKIEQSYRWSLWEVEYSTDIAFQRRADLQAIYGNLMCTAIHTVKPDNIATFLGKKLNVHFEGELGTRYNVRIEGTRVRHSMDKASIKMYDKFGQILRIETTTTNVSFFRHYRKVEQRNGETVMKFARMKKSIYSLAPLRELMAAANRRYLDFLSAIEDPSSGVGKLHKVTRTVHESARSYRGFNFFDQDDEAIFLALARGEFNISGMQNKTLRAHFPQHNSGQMSRILRRLRAHGLIKKAAHSYKYYLTAFGKQVVTLGLKLKELVIIPQLATASV